MARHVLRVPRSDEESAFILIQAESAGSKPLDLKLIATEGEAPYVLKLRHDRVSSLRVKSSTVTPQEWETLLTSVLLEGELPDDIETTAAVYAESEITVTVRKRVQGITQRLGSFSITYEPDEGIELFEWCGLAIDARDKIKASTTTHTSKIKELENDVSELKKQLDEFIGAKESDEAVLLEKFRDLLNEKKLKIREQQRLLASAASSKDQLTKASPTRSAGPSRPSKRKAKVEPEDTDDGFNEAPPVVDPNSRADDSAEDRETTDHNTETTDDGGDGDEDDLPPTTRHRAVAKKKTPTKAGGRGGKTRGKAVAAQASPPAKKDDVPPPRRELPFTTRKAAAQQASKAPQKDDSETQSEEEL